MKKEQAELCLRQTQRNSEMKMVLDCLNDVDVFRKDFFDGSLADFELLQKSIDKIVNYFQSTNIDGLKSFIDEIAEEYQEFIEIKKYIGEEEGFIPPAELKEFVDIKRQAKSLYLDLCHWYCENCDKPFLFMDLAECAEK